MYMSHSDKSKVSVFSDGLGFRGVKDPVVRDFPFVISINDKTDKPKAFNNRGYSDFNEVLEAVKDRTNVCQFIKNPLRMLYWDIDHVQFNDAQLVEFIDQFLVVLNGELMTGISLKDLHIHTKNGVDKLKDKIVSIHIICPSYHMNNERHRTLAINMKSKMPNIDIDRSVYNRGGRLYNCFNGKIGGNLFQYHSINKNPYKLLWLDNPTESDPISYDAVVEVETIYIDTDTLDHILKNKKKFLKYSYEWVEVTKYVKLGGHMTREEWCKKSLVGDWTYEQNLEAWAELDTQYTFQDIDQLTSIVAQTRFIPNPINNRFFNFINASPTTQTAFKNRDLTQKLVCVDGIIMNTKTGVLQRPDEPTILYYQECYKTMKPKDGRIIRIRADKLKEQLDQHQNLFINGVYGCGKTYSVIGPIVDGVRDHNLECDKIGGGERKSVLVVTENNALNSQYQTDLKMNSHLNQIFNSELQVCSLESLCKLTYDTYDILILDEYVSLMSHFLSNETMRNKEADIYIKLMKYMTNCNRLIVCDADLTHSTYSAPLDDVAPNRTIHKITTKHYDKYTYNLVFDKDIIHNRINQNLIDGKRVIVAFDTKSKAICYEATICDIRENGQRKYNVLSVYSEDGSKSDGIKYNNEDLSSEKLLFLYENNYQKFIKEYHVHIMIYTPKITTGVSINGECFDNQYGIAYGNSVSARQFVQMLHRARNLTDENVYIRVPEPRAKSDMSYINAEYMENHYSTQSKIFQEIVNTKLRPKTKRGLTEIIMEAEAERQRSKKCFTSEIYQQFKSLNLTTNIILSDDTAYINYEIFHNIQNVTSWLNDGLMTLYEIEKMIKLEKSGSMLTKLQHINKHYLHIFLKHTITYTIKTEAVNPDDEPIEELRFYYFNGLFEYDKLHGIYPRLDEKLVQDYSKIKTYRENLGRFNTACELSEQELKDKYIDYFKNTTENVIAIELKYHTAFYFYKKLNKIERNHGSIVADSLTFSPNEIEIINHFQPKKKLNDGSKKAELVMAISRIVKDICGTTIIQHASNRKNYIMKTHPSIIDGKYESDFRSRLEALGIQEIVCRSPLKNKIVSLEPTANDMGNYYKRKPNPRRRTDQKYILDVKHDTNNNAIVTRKMSGTPYPTSPMYRDIVPTGTEDHFFGLKPNKNKVDVPIITEVVTYEYPIIPKHRLDMASVYEPNINYKTKQLSKQTPNLSREDMAELSKDISNELKVRLEDQFVRDNDFERCFVGDVIFVEYNPYRVNVFDKDNHVLEHNQEKSVYYFIFQSYTSPIKLYRAVVRTGYNIECDYEATDEYTKCDYIDYKLGAISRVSDELEPSKAVSLPYLIDGTLPSRVHYEYLSKSPTHTLINSGSNRRYFKHVENEIIHNHMEQETMMRYMLKNWRRRINDKKPQILEPKITIKSKPCLKPKPKPKPKPEPELEPTPEPDINYHKNKLQAKRNIDKTWANGIMRHMVDVR